MSALLKEYPEVNLVYEERTALEEAILNVKDATNYTYKNKPSDWTHRCELKSQLAYQGGTDS